MKRSKFSLSHYKLFSCDMGELVPIAVTEVLPGDTIQHSTNALVRAAPLLAPVMHQVQANIRHFFVPNRLIWDEFEDFITGGPDGLNASVHPQINIDSTIGNVGGLADYMGLPDPPGAAYAVSALPFRAYALIWNEYYRDQDLQTALVIDDTSGLDTTTPTALQRVNWEKDYFTTARPWEQKGPTLSVPVETTGQSFQVRSNQVPNTDQLLAHSAANPGIASIAQASGVTGNIRFGTNTGLAVDLSLIREAMALQRFEEARARFGSRYVEYLRYLGVQSSDARLQRPEYLGGGQNNIQFSEVLQTAEGTDPVGDLKGHGIAAMRSNRYRRYFEEHGLVISLFSVRPKPIYINAVQKLWSRSTRDEYYTKELAHIGQEIIQNKQIDGLHTTPNGTFGYQDRYDDYRRAFSSVGGEFRTSTLNYWHLARDLSNPALNSAFITCNPTERVFAVPSQDVLYVMARHSIQARRLVNKSGASSFVM